MAAEEGGPCAISVGALRAAVTEAVREELTAGLGSIRSIVREELDRDGGSSSASSSSGEEEECPEGEERKLVICVRHDLGMSPGKVGAQVGHAVHSALREARWLDLRAWEATGSKKVCLKVASEAELLEIQAHARRLGLVSESVQDAGHTEVEPGTTTVLAVGPALAAQIDKVTGGLKPLPDPAERLARENEKLRSRAERLQRELDEAKRQRKQLAQLMRGCQRAVL